MKKSHFLVIGDFYLICFVIYGNVWVVTGEPPPYCAKIPTKSPVFMVVFFFVFKKLGLGQTHPSSSLGQNPNFDQIFFASSPKEPSPENILPIILLTLSQLIWGGGYSFREWDFFLPPILTKVFNWLRVSVELFL